MQVSRERLKSVDAELAQLGKSDDEIAAILARFETGARQDLDAVDAALADLVRGRADLEAILAEVRSEGARAAYMDAEIVEGDGDDEALRVSDADIEPVEEEDLSTVGGTMEAIRLDGDAAVVAMLDEVAAAGPGPDPDLDLDTFDGLRPEPNSPLAILEAAAQGDGLSAEELFGEDPFAAEGPAPDEGAGDLSDLFYANQLSAIAEGVEDEVGRLSDVLEAVHPTFDDEHEGEVESTTIFSPEDIASIAGDDDPSSSPSEAPAALAALDELLDDEFELLVDEDILEEEEPIQAKSAGPPPPPPPPPFGIPPEPDEATEAVHIDDPYAEGQALDDEDEDDEDDEDDADKKGFFKKLFGSKKSSPPKS